VTAEQIPAGDQQKGRKRPRLPVMVAHSRSRPLAGARGVGIQLLLYITNHLISQTPSYTLRHLWYRRVVGIEIGRGAALQLGLKLWFHGPRHVRRGGNRIGPGTLVNRDCALDTRGGLRIGSHVSISPEVAILTADHDRDRAGFPLRVRPVVIEDHVWIGVRATVLPGVHIGRGAVVAAGAVVTRDVAPLSIVAGVPARVIGRRDPDGLNYAFNHRSPPLFE
jgi:acetyltransferase-like isoleucine patch superfamily enzyme